MPLEWARLEKSRAGPIPCSPSFALLHSPAIPCCSGAKQQTARKTFASLVKPFCFKEESCRPFCAARRMMRRRRSPQTIILMESPATQPLQTGGGEAVPGPAPGYTGTTQGNHIFPFLKSAPKDRPFFSPEYFPVAA